MCYGSGCPNEIISGPRIGDCRGGKSQCPPSGEICNVCGADTECDDPVCNQCQETLELENIK